MLGVLVMIRLGFLGLALLPHFSAAQALRIPQNANYSCNAGRRVGVTDIQITWNAPGVKGREGKIWGTNVAWYGFQAGFWLRDGITLESLCG